MEVEATVDAAVGSLFLIGGARAHLAQGPPLELVLVLGGQLGGSGVVGGLADYFTVKSP